MELAPGIHRIESILGPRPFSQYLLLVEGTEGVARGTIGWPDYPEGSPSTIDFTTRLQPGYWFLPRWEERWFPQAFIGTMGQLMRALEEGSEPEISGRDNLRTMALVEAAYRSAGEGRAVRLDEIVVEVRGGEA